MAQDLPASTENFDELVSQFNDNHPEPLKVEAAGQEWRDGVSIQDVSYTGSGGERLQAYWVVPAGEGPFPGVIYVHPAPGDRTTFLEEAVLLGKQGVASLVVEAPWAQTDHYFQIAEAQKDRLDWLQTRLRK